MNNAWARLQELWYDESAVIVTMELVLIATIIVIGVLAGMTALRDAVLTEMADLGGSISRMDQSYILHGSNSASAATATTMFVDRNDYADDPADPLATNERFLIICGGTIVVPPAGNEPGT